MESIDEMTVGEVKRRLAEAQELAKVLGQSAPTLSGGGGGTHSFEVGLKYLIRGVTMYYVGKLVSVTDSDLVLESASWVASTGRFHHALATGELDEVEPFSAVAIVPRGAIVDATRWDHDLPTEAK